MLKQMPVKIAKMRAEAIINFFLLDMTTSYLPLFPLFSSDSISKFCIPPEEDGVYYPTSFLLVLGSSSSMISMLCKSDGLFGKLS